MYFNGLIKLGEVGGGQLLQITTALTACGRFCKGWSKGRPFHGKVDILFLKLALAEEAETELVTAYDCVLVQRMVLRVEHLLAEVKDLI